MSRTATRVVAEPNLASLEYQNEKRHRKIDGRTMRVETHTDFEAFVDANRQAEHPKSDRRWMAKNNGGGLWKTETLSAGDCMMLRGHCGAEIISEGVAPPHGYTFYTPKENNSWINLGEEFGRDALYIWEPGHEYCTASTCAATYHGFFVPKQIAEVSIKRRSERQRRSYLLHDNLRITETVRYLFQSAIELVSKNPSAEHSGAMRMIEAELKSLLLPLLTRDGGHNTAFNDFDHAHYSSFDYVAMAHRYIENMANRPIHVSEISDNLGISERTLRRAFNETYQIGPRTYLFLRQMHKIRNDLVRAHYKETTVTDILTRWGVWEFGRFSGRYKKHFGEYPLQTLRRPPLLTRFV